MRTNERLNTWWRIPLALSLLCLLLPLVLTTRQQAAAEVTITEFSDFQCPYCQRAATVVEQVRKTYGAHVKVVFKQMPLRMHQHAFQAAQASVCAREQGKFWEYHDRLFAASDLSVDRLNRMASTVGLNQTDFSQCLSSEKSKAEVEQDVAEAERLGVSGTPTFIVNGQVVRGTTTFAALKQEIDSAMTRRNHPLLGSSSTGDSPFVENTESPSSIRPQVSGSKKSATSVSSATPGNLLLKDQQASSTTTASERAGVSAVPAFFINGVLVTGAQPASVFQRIIDRDLAGNKQSAPASTLVDLLTFDREMCSIWPVLCH